MAAIDSSEAVSGMALPRLVAGMRRHAGLSISIALLAIIVLLALFAPVLAPRDPYAQDLGARQLPPIWHAWLYHNAKAGWAHPLGTDRLGRDYLSRLLYGGRISLLIGFAAALLSGVIGTALGLASGYLGRRVDLLVGFFITARLSMPVMLVALSVVALFGGSLATIIIVLGCLLWDRCAVVVRIATRQAAGRDYVAAAGAMGFGTLHILLREILPNILNPLIVVLTLEMSHAILAEAALSFLGLGVPPPMPSWGLMLAEAKQDMFFNPWMITIPGIALSLLVLAINLIGDGLRDVLTPGSRA